MIYNNFFSWKKQELSLNLESQEDVCREAGRSDPPRQTRLLQWEQYRYWGRAMLCSHQAGKNSQLNPKDWMCNWQWPSEVKKLQQCIGTVGGLRFPPGNALQPFLPQTLQPRVPTWSYHTERSHWEAHLSTQGGCARMSLQRVTSNLHQGRIYPELGSLGLNLDCKMYFPHQSSLLHASSQGRKSWSPSHQGRDADGCNKFSYILLLLCFAFFDSFYSFCHSCMFSYLFASTPACTCIYKCSFFSIVCSYAWGSSVCLSTMSINGHSLLCFPRTICIYSHILTSFPLSLFLLTARQL